MSTVAIVLIAAGAVILLLLAGGLVIARRRRERPDYSEHVAAADAALEQARAADRGWDRRELEDAARRALAEQRPDLGYEQLHLVLVDDRPGVTEDTAHFVAVFADGEARVVLERGTQGWFAARVE
jgi:LPXTG-motif cell wall-anchored protein